MGFRDYPFLSPGLAHRDSRRFPGHREVLHYINDFTTEFGVTDLIRFEVEVVYTGLGADGKWRLRSRRGNDEEVDEIFDAVVVCTAMGITLSPYRRNSRVFLTSNQNLDAFKVQLLYSDGLGALRTILQGALHICIDAWPGKQMHSHNYRIPEPFRDQVVILIGNAFSADDISRDIAQVAKEVHVASRSVESVHRDGTVIFQDGSGVLADVIMHCTGYEYYFPFLDTNGIVTVDDNRVGPLYKHIFPPALAPGLSFVGLPWMAPLFAVFELQSQWIAGVLSGRIGLPSHEEMMKDVEAFYLSLEAYGTPMPEMVFGCFEYIDWVAAACGLPRLEEWRKKMYHAVFVNNSNQRHIVMNGKTRTW
ncbi:Flavin-containing monooxygenase FMO GS-OX-like 3 [Vitis vinifera]|uniref:Flavin-containing monooxygenase n=1 Tax=Vitis vinifera TaxID=29760 RepID=A0A438K2L2_VITVI|nr:Flavin-containing monooxygenase FMO GS-OX-like 3 [Vitis vinifera]